MTEFIDLTEFMNHRMNYPKGTYVYAGMDIAIDNIYFYEEDFVFDKVIDNNGIEFVFRKTPDGTDNVVCGGQEIHLGGLSGQEIHICGFCSFGWHRDYFVVNYSDGTSDKLEVVFSDICWPLANFTGFNNEHKPFEKASQVFTKYSVRHWRLDRDVSAHIFYNSFKLNPDKEIESIKFPDNTFMNIFGITIKTAVEGK